MRISVPVQMYHNSGPDRKLFYGTFLYWIPMIVTLRRRGRKSTHESSSDFIGWEKIQHFTSGVNPIKEEI